MSIGSQCFSLHKLDMPIFHFDHVWAEFKNSHYGDFCITINLRLSYIIAVFLLGTQATRNSCQILEILLFLVLELLSLLLEVVYRATVLKGASASTIVRPREQAVLPDLRSLEWILLLCLLREVL